MNIYIILNSVEYLKTLNLMFYIWYFKLNSDKSYYETFYFENERNIHLKSLYQLPNINKYVKQKNLGFSSHASAACKSQGNQPISIFKISWKFKLIQI